MGSQAAQLLDEVERDVLDEGVPLAACLRKIIILGGKAGSEELCAWAGQELRGYDGIDGLPDYRKVGAPLKVNGINGRFHYTAQTISSAVLPEFARETVNETLHLIQPIGEIEAMWQKGRASDEAINLAPAGGADLVRYMNSRSGPYEQLLDLYWSVSPVTLAGVVDRVRTTLTELLAEMRRTTPPEAAPSPEAAAQAVNVAVYGRARVNLSAQQVATGSTVMAPPAASAAAPESGFWTTGRRVGAAVTGVVGLGATAIGAAAEAGWL